MHRAHDPSDPARSPPVSRELEPRHRPVRNVGEIHVRGDVPDLCDVRAGADVLVAGTVEAADVAAGRDVCVAGGIVSRKKGICRAARDLSCRFATYSTLEAGQHLHVACDVAHCQLTAGGRVSVAGRILAGQTSGTQGIECKNAGSSGGVMTILACGIDPDLNDRCDARLSQLDTLRDEERRTRHKLELLRGHIPLQGKTHPDLVWQIEHQCSCVRNAQAEALAFFERMCADFAGVAGDCTASITVGEMLHPGVIIRFPGAEAKIDTPFVGPLRIVCKTIRGEQQIQIESGSASVPLETRCVMSDPLDRMRRIVEISIDGTQSPSPVTPHAAPNTSSTAKAIAVPLAAPAAGAA